MGTNLTCAAAGAAAQGQAAELIVYTGTGILFSSLVMGTNLTYAAAGAAAQGQAAELIVYT